MDIVTPQQLAQIMPHSKKRIPIYIDWLNFTMAEFAINTLRRKAGFLAQIAHESGELRYVRELASGAEYDVGEKAKRLGNTPEKDGDGQHHKGTGLIQLTGKSNHYRCARFFKVPLEDIVRWLQTPEGACRSAGWFWKVNNLSWYADRGDFRGLTKRINGGYTHYGHRHEYYVRALKALSTGK